MLWLTGETVVVTDMFDAERAEIRFGCGLSPQIAPVESVAEMLARLRGPDEAAQAFPIPPFESIYPLAMKFIEARSQFYHPQSESDRRHGKTRFTTRRREMRHDNIRWVGQLFLRRARGRDGMRERLTAFWADHFTAVGRNSVTRMAQPIYVEEAIRPHVSGRFADMLKAVITHPVMLVYLDQNSSVGPNSPIALNGRKRKRGLNENLARELLELHTLGVGGPYTQKDVRQLAELLTGLRFSVKKGFAFQPGFAEPGPETVLGKSYGGEDPSLDDIHAVLEDLAVHPATATHVAGKLAVHFVSDAPDPGLISEMAARYTETGGDLHAVYEAMLNHPSAWDFSQRNVKQPVDFIGSALRALDLAPDDMPTETPVRLFKMLIAPMTLMGQEWAQAPGPDGWPEADAEWVTPQRLAARLQWALTAPAKIRRALPDPREFVETALGRQATEAVRFAAGAAEERAEGIGLVLASPAFQRM